MQKETATINVQGVSVTVEKITWKWLHHHTQQNPKTVFAQTNVKHITRCAMPKETAEYLLNKFEYAGRQTSNLVPWNNFNKGRKTACDNGHSTGDMEWYGQDARRFIFMVRCLTELVFCGHDYWNIYGRATRYSSRRSLLHKLIGMTYGTHHDGIES